VNSSLDLDEVLSMIVMHAVQMSGTDGGSIMEFDEGVQEFHVRAAYGTSQQLLDDLRHTRIDLANTLVGRAATGGRPLVVADLQGQPLDAHTERLYSAGWRSILAIPMLREGRIVGVLVVRRKTAGGYSADIVDVLETFASQSAVAILNARLYREVERKSAELEVASRHKSEFLASMSHELRTPLNAVIGFSEVLLERMFGELNDRQEEYLHDILSSGQHLLELLNDILDLSKVEAGQMELDRSTFSVQQAIDYGVSMVRERAVQHDIDIVCNVAPEVHNVHADPLRYRQVLLNLLTNAVKFTPDGGTITVEANTDGEVVTLTVTDTGIGIAPEDRARIFESFQQGSRAARRQEGTGLGLTLSRRIVDLHEGRMWLDSEVGVGSTFGFAVPATLVTSPVRTTRGQSTGRPAIVVIEDDPHSMDLLLLYLDGLDMDIVGTGTGEEGLAVIRELRPRAVILDLRLPGMDGWELLSAISGDPALTEVPVIVASVVDDRPRGLALGAAVYLVKPVTRDEILTALATVHAIPLAGSDASVTLRPEAS
jgi:signal transduction histidine kinase/CheY-like chemotaxis protein